MDEAPSIRRAFPPGAAIGFRRAADGHALRWMDWRQPAGGEGKARGSLLFLGGRGDFIEKYLEPYHHWHARGWNVAAADWRGQGASRGDIAGGNLASFDPPIADLAALAAAWRAETPGPHVAIAHSMGAHMLLRALVERRAPIDAAVLVAPMILVNSRPIPGAIAPYVAGLMCRLGLGGRPMMKTPKAMLEPGASRQAYLTSSLERYADEAWWWAREPGYRLGLPSWAWLCAAYASGRAAFTPAKLGAVDVPILILGTETDRLVSAKAIRAAAARLPKAELHMYEAAGHEILREADPVRCDALARIDAFLDRAAP